jgi:hypothetical protein
MKKRFPVNIFLARLLRHPQQSGTLTSRDLFPHLEKTIEIEA